MSDDLVRRLQDAYPATQDMQHPMLGNLLDEAEDRIEADGKMIAELDRALRWIRDNPGAHWHTVVEVADRALRARLEGGRGVMPYENFGSAVMMDLIRRLAEAYQKGDAARGEQIARAVKVLEEEYPDAAAELERLYPIQPDKAPGLTTHAARLEGGEE